MNNEGKSASWSSRTWTCGSPIMSFLGRWRWWKKSTKSWIVFACHAPLGDPLWIWCFTGWSGWSCRSSLPQKGVAVWKYTKLVHHHHHHHQNLELQWMMNQCPTSKSIGSSPSSRAKTTIWRTDPSEKHPIWHHRATHKPCRAPCAVDRCDCLGTSPLFCRQWSG